MSSSSARAPVLSRLRSEEIAEVAALSARCFPDGSWGEAELTADLERSFAEVWVAREDDHLAIVGYAIVWFAGDDGDVLTIGTEPRMRRRGIGRTLVARLQRSAVERAVRSLTLEVRPSNEPACALYEEAGFELVATRKRYYSDGEDALFMAWAVPAAS
jgi:ribosomal-protein-alanine acetyltransferase